MRLAGSCFLLLAVAGIATAQDTNFPVGPQYLPITGSPQFARSIATPSLSLNAPLPEIKSLPEVGPAVSDQNYTANPELQHQADLFPIFYGHAPASIIEISSTELPRNLPASIVNAGVVGMTDTASLRERGYGVTVGETASFWKTHKAPAPRLYTNRDIERLHGG
jgi:hypothetical protein